MKLPKRYSSAITVSSYLHVTKLNCFKYLVYLNIADLENVSKFIRNRLNLSDTEMFNFFELIGALKIMRNKINEGFTLWETTMKER